jgi:hypothetical protein
MQVQRVRMTGLRDAIQDAFRRHKSLHVRCNMADHELESRCIYAEHQFVRMNAKSVG